MREMETRTRIREYVEKRRFPDVWKAHDADFEVIRRAPEEHFSFLCRGLLGRHSGLILEKGKRCREVARVEEVSDGF